MSGLKELIPFARVAQELYSQYEARPDATRVIQMGRVWLTWGDFRRALATLSEADHVAQNG